MPWMIEHVCVIRRRMPSSIRKPQTDDMRSSDPRNVIKGLTNIGKSVFQDVKKRLSSNIRLLHKLRKGKEIWVEKIAGPLKVWKSENILSFNFSGNLW